MGFCVFVSSRPSPDIYIYIVGTLGAFGGVTTVTTNQRGRRKFERRRNRRRSTGHLRKFFPSMKKMLTAGVGYSGRAALRREQCDVHAVGQQKSTEVGRCVATGSHATIEGTAVFFVVRSGTTIRQCFLWGLTKGYISPKMMHLGNPLSGGYKYGEIECWRGPAANLLY
jgi:hypothetical protein